MSETPLVSVIIPTWNRVALVQQAIASVVAQSHVDWELIVVDDGSTDGTVDELNKLDDPRIQIIAIPHSGSTAKARNRGIEAAKGEWIAFLDSDDLWLPEKLELQLRALAQSGASWSYANYSLMDEEGAELQLRAGAFRALSGRIIEPLLRGRTAVHVDCLVVRRDVLKAIGQFDVELTNREDLDLDFRLAEAADAVGLSNIVARVRDHPARKTAATDFPHERTARVYENFLRRAPERGLARIARAKLARHSADAAADRLAVRHFATGLGWLARSILLGDSPAHWARAAGRGIRQLIAR